jgi:hypothetical protein
MNGSNSFEELFEKYQALVAENNALKEENRVLKDRLGVEETNGEGNEPSGFTLDQESDAQQSPDVGSISEICSRSGSEKKIRLFMSLFKGRDDVYARRWESKNKGMSGYSPSCLNEWKLGLCRKPKGTCAGCAHKAYAALDENVIDEHLRGNMVAGIYPMLPDRPAGSWRSILMMGSGKRMSRL